MRLTAASVLLSALLPRVADAQTCEGTTGPFTLIDLRGVCDYDYLLEEYTRQVFDVTGATCMEGSTRTAKEDFDIKLVAATGEATGEEGAAVLCRDMHDNYVQTPFTDAASKGDDLHFEQMFYNGRGDWQEEVETNAETDDGSPSSRLRGAEDGDANKVNEFYQGDGSYSRVEWPDTLTNFEESTCSMNAAMCCWPKDRQANDNNGNCATPYSQNCVNKDPADNTNLCFADYDKGNMTTGLDSAGGFAAFPQDNGDGEGAIHCHGFAWADDEYEHTARYKANNLFFVSMYDHMHQRGYVENIPGMPMCACLDQMPIVTRSDCTQVDLTEDWEVTFDGENFQATMLRVDIDFNACRGRGNENNDLYAYAARLYDEGRMSREKFGKIGRVLSEDHDCHYHVENALHEKGYVVGHAHDEDNWTFVAGRDDVEYAPPMGNKAFLSAFVDNKMSDAPIMMRICPDCVETHRRVFYRRLTPIPEGLFLLHNLMFYRNNGNGKNVWNVDFSLHSTYEDAQNAENPWKCQNNAFDYGAPFVGNCSPSGTRVHNQYSVFNWYPGPQRNVAYYVNKPQAAGAQDYINNGDVTRAFGLTDVDIGDVGGVAGNTLENDGTFHITSAGRDVWATSDSFHYKSQPWEGDIDVSVEVTDFISPVNQPWAKAGIMLRSDNSEDATYAFNMLSFGNGVHTQFRRSKGRHADHVQAPYVNQQSAKLRIMKKMDLIQFYKHDGDDWVLTHQETLFFPDDTYRVGLAVTSAYTGVIAEATFVDYEIATYEFPTSAPSTSAAPTAWEPLVEVGEPQQIGNYDISYQSKIPANAVATQVDTCHGGAAARAIDGNRNGEWHSNSVTHTCSDNAWWQVDLVEDTVIDSITVVNRQDCCQDRMSGANIHVLDADQNMLATLPFKTSSNSYVFDFGGITGRFVKITNNKIINIAEVIVDDLSSPPLTEVMKGSGTGIWGKSDSFAFYSDMYPANIDLTAELYLDIDHAVPQSRGGIMFRESEAEDAAYVFVGAAGHNQGAVFQSRAVAGQHTDHHNMIWVNNDSRFWVKLEKIGDVMTAYYKEEESDDYVELGSIAVTFGSNFLVGKAVTRGDDYQWGKTTMDILSYSVSV